MNKSGFIMSPADFIKGIIVGFFLGATVIFLGTKGLIPIPGL